MRFSTALVAALVALPGTALASDHPDAPRRTLRGHTFMTPASFNSAFIETTIINRTSARHESVSDIPIGPSMKDITVLGVREQLAFSAALGQQVSLGLEAFSEFAAGTSARALATQGVIYAYGVAANGTFRILRIEESGTQLSARAELFGIQGGARLSLGPFIQAVRSNPLLSTPDAIRNFGNLLTTPTSWWGFAGSVDLAQTFNETFSLQAEFRLDVKRFTQSPFVPGTGRVDIHSTGVLPQVGVAFGVNPPEFPVAFLAEYRAAAQDSDDPTSLAHHLLAVGIYYSGRADLQVGPVFFGEFGLPPVNGIDANGDLTPSQRGVAFSGQLMMQYFW
jgi:hypothetical protein